MKTKNEIIAVVLDPNIPVESAEKLCGTVASLRSGEQQTVCISDFSNRRLENTVSACGMDRFLLFSHEEFWDHTAYAKKLKELLVSLSPQIVLCAGDQWGKSVAPLLAAMLGTGLTAECTSVFIGNDGLLHQKRTAYGGSLLADIVCPVKRPQMATLMMDGPPAPSRRAEKCASCRVEIYSLEGESRILRLECQEKIQKKPLQSARLIFAGGKGLGREGFQVLKELAAQYGAALGATRSAVDAGYAPYECQIGQSGISVCPEIYMAVGISGAVQHIAGINRAKRIIAVNSDPKAPIFDYADEGLVCGWREFFQKML